MRRRVKKLKKLISLGKSVSNDRSKRKSNPALENKDLPNQTTKTKREDTRGTGREKQLLLIGDKKKARHLPFNPACKKR